MSSPLLKVKPVANDEIAADESAKLQIDVHLLVRPLHEHHRIDLLGLELLQQLDQLLQGMPRIVDILNNEHMFIGELFRFQFSFNLKFAGGLSALIALAPDEFVSVVMLDFFDQIREEHEGALQDTDDHQFQFPLLGKDGGVVFVDLLGEVGDYLLDVLLGVEKLEGEALVGNCCHITNLNQYLSVGRGYSQRSGIGRIVGAYNFQGLARGKN